MKAKFIGTGDAFSRRYGHTNALIEAGDIRLLLDCGSLTPARLEELNCPLDSITHVLISHIHADHVGGLEELAFMSRFVHRHRARLLLPGELAHLLWDHSLRGGLEMVADEEGRTEKCTLDTYFEAREVGIEWVDLGALQIKPFQTDHVPGKHSFGFIVRDSNDGQQMIFAGDTRTRIAELLEQPLDPDFASGPIFHDCLLAPGGAWSIHLPLADLIYPAEVQERIALVHYHDGMEDALPAIRAAGLKVVLPGQVIETPDWRACLDAP